MTAPEALSALAATPPATRPAARRLGPPRLRGGAPLQRFGWSVAGWIGIAILRGLRASLRFRFHDDQDLRRRESAGETFVLAFWHRHLLLMPYAYGGRGVVAMVSQSDAGEWLTAVLGHFGIRTVRGSTSRGGLAALHELVRLGRAGMDLAVAPDGPRGPAGEVKQGVLAAAAAAGCPIVPIAWSVRRHWRLKTWDKMLLPSPLGGTVHFVAGPALEIGRRDDLGAAARELKRRLDAAERRACALAGLEDSECVA